jgi:hypothetical protein
MSNGATKDYKFGNKNNWRRWKWNRIVERLMVRPRDAVTLYLAGQDDLDRPIAKSHGFRDENLIAIDRSSQVVESLRSSSAVALQADFVTALHSLSPGRAIHVVDADFCCDAYDGVVAPLVDALMFSPELRECVVSVNFCRGRASSMSEVRKSLIDGEKVTHRGELFFIRFVHKAIGEPAQDLQINPWLPVIATEVLRRANAVRTSYYSAASRQYFDAVVFNVPRHGHRSQDALSELAEILGEDVDSRMRRQLTPDTRTKRRLAAAFAHRTMRAAAVGPYARTH